MIENSNVGDYKKTNQDYKWNVNKKNEYLLGLSNF